MAKPPVMRERELSSQVLWGVDIMAEVAIKKVTNRYSGRKYSLDKATG